MLLQLRPSLRPMMPKRPIKSAALLLALMAAAKIGIVEYLQRAATRDAMVLAYSSQAIEACQKVKPLAGLQATAMPWSRPHDMRLIIGDRRHAVGLWQVDHEFWASRYRTVFLVLSAGPLAAPERCAFDIAGKTAVIMDQL